MPKRNDISSDLREATIAGNQFKSFYSEKVYSQVEIFKAAVSLPRSGHPSKFTPSMQWSEKPQKRLWELHLKICRLNVEVYATIRKGLNKYGLFGEKASLLQKERDPTARLRVQPYTKF